jgi:FAD binding domain
MNTGVQDTHNLAWKLALAVEGHAAPALLDSYDAERRPVGDEVVGRTVRSARQGTGADSPDPDFVIRREAQLLIDYADSPVVATGGGGRADDAAGLTRDGHLAVYLIAAPDADVAATVLDTTALTDHLTATFA